MSDNLNKSIVKGVSWNLIETISVYTARFVIGIILARILFPADFGLIGMITIFITISDVFVNAGFGQAFIQKKDASKKDANTIFVVNFLLGICIYSVLYFAAPLIAKFFNEPQLVALVRVLSIVIVINSLNVIQHSIIRKELQFKKRAVLTIIATLTSGCLGIYYAYHGLGVWSLVIQQVANRIILCCLLYIKSQWRLSFSYSHESAKALFSVGGWMLCGNLVLTTFNNLYRLVIGKLFSDVQLGLYERSKQFETMVADTFTMVLGNVSFPVFSKLQDSSSDLKNATANFIKYSCILIFPILACLLVMAKPFICWIITDKWMMAVPYLQLLCIVGFIVPINFFIGQILQAIGKAKQAFYYTVGLSLLRILNIVISYRFGVEGIIIGEGVVLSLSTVVMSLYIYPIIGFSYLGCLKQIIGLTVATLISIGVGYYFSCLIEYLGNFLQTLLITIVMMSIYCLGIILLERNIFRKFISIFR